MQYHPEASPGPHDADYLFQQFLESMERSDPMQPSALRTTGAAERLDNDAKPDDIKRVLVIGSGPIVIGQACEFDYSGTQACKALRAEGLEVVLVNSNPATIMTDPEMADRTYVEPLTVEAVRSDHRARSVPTRCCRPSAARRRSTSRSRCTKPACSTSTASS